MNSKCQLPEFYLSQLIILMCYGCPLLWNKIFISFYNYNFYLVEFIALKNLIYNLLY